MKKYLCLSSVLIFVLNLFAFTGCRRNESGELGGLGGNEQIDVNKTQLYVGNYYGALRDEWFTEIKARFESDNPTVQVWLDNETDSYNDKNLINRLGTARQDIYFTNGITYDAYVQSGKLADLTDLVTTPMNDLYQKEDGSSLFSETYTIADNMNDTLSDYYRTADGKYYAIPFYEALFGLVYDIDLFESKKLYYRDGFEENPNIEARFVTNLSQTKSAGPDGVKNTSDDGLPATYSQFKDLWTVMKTRGVTPFIWNKHANYRQRYLMSVWADYEGKDNFNLNNSFNGSYQFEGDSLATKITEYNAGMLMKQKGHEYALQYAYDIVKDPNNYYALSFGPSNTHTAAQDVFLDSSRKQQPIGMIMEATWWENEAGGTFDEMAATYGEEYSRKHRKFGFMPVPKSDDGKSNKGSTLLGVSAHSVICIDKESPNKELALKFLAYCQTQAGLAEFTKKTGVVRAYDYELSDAQYNSMSTFGRSVWDLYTAETSNIVYNNIYTSEHKLSNSGNYTFWGWEAIIGGAQYLEPFDAFYADAKLTVAEYLVGTLEAANSYNKK